MREVIEAQANELTEADAAKKAEWWEVAKKAATFLREKDRKSVV